jgi:hypothetical protein
LGAGVRGCHIRQSIGTGVDLQKPILQLSNTTKYKYLFTARYGVDGIFRGPEDEGLPDSYLDGLSAISVNIDEVQYGSR